MARTNKRYGWIPDLPDQRDFVYAAPAAVVRKLPDKADLRPHCPPVYDQGELGSCTANAIGAAHQFDQLKQNSEGSEQKIARGANRASHSSLRRRVAPPSIFRPNCRVTGGASYCEPVLDAAVANRAGREVFVPSRLFIYYNERVIEGTVDQDSGAMIRDGIKSVAKQGVCPEPEWPYVIAKYRNRPSQACYKHALDHQALTYYRVRQTSSEFKGCLAAGYPFVFGFSVYESFESATVARTGKVPMPRKGESLVGGHAVMAVGYDNSGRCFIVRNSWGTRWGLKGYFKMPYEYLLNDNLAADFWTIRLVE